MKTGGTIARTASSSAIPAARGVSAARQVRKTAPASHPDRASACPNWTVVAKLTTEVSDTASAIGSPRMSARVRQSAATLAAHQPSAAQAAARTRR